MNFKTPFILLLTISTLHLSAQKPSDEFSIHGSGGVPISSSFAGFGGNIGLGYTVFAGRPIAIHFGAGMEFNTINTKINKLKTLTPNLMDDNEELFDLHTTLSDYNEIQRTTFFSMPIMLQFQQSLGRTQMFYAMGGAKIVFRYQTAYEANVAAFNNTAYYTDYENQAGTQTFADLGTFKGNRTTGNFELGLLTMLAFETGLKWRVGANTFLYTGVYLDHALSDPAKDSRKPLRNYTHSEQLAKLTLLQFADHITLTTAGLKLRLAFSQSSQQKQKTRRSGKMIPCSY